MWCAGLGRVRAAHGPPDGAERVHGEAHQADAGQGPPADGARVRQCQFLVHPLPPALHAARPRENQDDGRCKYWTTYETCLAQK